MTTFMKTLWQGDGVGAAVELVNWTAAAGAALNPHWCKLQPLLNEVLLLG